MLTSTLSGKSSLLFGRAVTHRHSCFLQLHSPAPVGETHCATSAMWTTPVLEWVIWHFPTYLKSGILETATSHKQHEWESIRSGLKVNCTVTKKQGANFTFYLSPKNENYAKEFPSQGSKLHTNTCSQSGHDESPGCRSICNILWRATLVFRPVIKLELNMLDTNFPVFFCRQDAREESLNHTTVVTEMLPVCIHGQRAETISLWYSRGGERETFCCDQSSLFVVCCLLWKH